MNLPVSISLLSAFLALFACIVSAEPSPSALPSPRPETGLEGSITISPTHGGPIREGESSSSPLVKKTFVVTKDGRTEAEFETDEQGRFRLLLPPGEYTVQGKEPKSRFERYGPMKVKIAANQMLSVAWDFDTGLR